jgi:hypothetical protein
MHRTSIAAAPRGAVPCTARAAAPTGAVRSAASHPTAS